ncbi:Chaperone protein DnaK [Elusimicrobium minutum Pei191]|uniref:Chaperone protein DnaK n=1 Tax=Elusimicrobium minutum (strain Pei191) TaxID=445932 RepID=DNAK_ELUMP|nr:molecular chaperone DnaK [Elusimicrobium minutum]B2KAX0.1 RecName: Full=Chaperone protein DnaK; AltName: Full=HSP70; AltName: Full=Heat shock 70 kDa protein; AltName: Full=Heat shock protein 70 [Elusimicrobium minutum Pei191]ACC97666.1 Chaperone protein DnaK [Elusimicrobium minutum Pei191]
MARIIGIDLGTSNTAAAAMEGGRATIIPSAEGSSIGGKAFPSYVAFTKDGQRLVGEPARRQAIANPEGTVTAFKRRMGEDYKFTLRGQEFTPQQLSAFVLQKVKKDAEAFLGEPVEKAVITVPAYFNDNQRQATKDAGRIAGLEVVRLVNEPTAAALAYGIDKAGKEQKIMVFDLGGGTLDVTIMEMGKEGTFDVLSTSGDTKLGGTDMDNAIIEWMVSEFKKSTGIDLSADKQAAQRLKDAAEKAKIELSTTMETDINLPFISAGADGPKHLELKLSRAKLESLVDSIVKRCGASIDQALNDSSLKSTEIDKIILVGGPTRMPIVQKYVEDHAGKKIERGIDPMECVATGAAVQAGILTGDVKDVLLLDVTPLSLGLETLGGVTTRLIERNTTIPVRKTQVFSTASDNQPAVTINVLQGERPMAKDNVPLGKFDLDGIPPAPRGVPQIEVTFDIDANGILNVSAKDLGTNKQQHITITSKTKLSDDEVQKFVKEAEKFADEDKKTKERVDAKNEADSVLFQTEKALKEHGDKVPQEDRLNIDRALGDLKEALKGDDVERIKKAKDDALAASQKLGEIIYKESQAKAQGAAGPQPGAQAQGQPNDGGKEDVVEAEVVDK